MWDDLVFYFCIASALSYFYCLKVSPILFASPLFVGLIAAVQVALLTIYDMCKAVDRGMVMGDVKLLEKSGGKSGEWKAGKL